MDLNQLCGLNELCLWLAGVCYLVGGIYATRLRSHIRIVLLYDWVSRPTQRIFDLISTIVIVLFATAVIYGGWEDAHQIIYNIGKDLQLFGIHQFLLL